MGWLGRSLLHQKATSPSCALKLGRYPELSSSFISGVASSALGHSLPAHSAPAPTNVRCCSNSGQIRVRRNCPLSARSGHNAIRRSGCGPPLSGSKAQMRFWLQPLPVGVRQWLCVSLRSARGDETPGPDPCRASAPCPPGFYTRPRLTAAACTSVVP
jgi:hypothetical protein